MSNNKKPLKVLANEFEFSIPVEEVETSDIIHLQNGAYNMVHHGRSVNVYIVAVDASGKKITAEVNGTNYEITIKDDLDQLIQEMGYNTGIGKHVKEIKAPMPGLVKEISVVEGQEVSEGDRILILEAMKMENSILIHGAGTIKKILVKPGDAVEKLQKLVELA